MASLQNERNRQDGQERQLKGNIEEGFGIVQEDEPAGDGQCEEDVDVTTLPHGQ